MTLETCKKRLELSKTPAEKAMWQEKIRVKLERAAQGRKEYAKYLSEIEQPREVEVKENGKKSKR